jgi:hypothetical protein
MEAITFHTRVEQDQVIRPPAGVSLPPGEVEVTVRPLPEQAVPGADPLAPTRAWLLALAAEAERLAPSLPGDLAEHHDHYAHGKPLP